MNFGKGKAFFGKFGKNFFQTKNSFNVFSSNANSFKSLINLSNKYYSHRLMLLNKSSNYAMNMNVLNYSLAALANETVTSQEGLNKIADLEGISDVNSLAMSSDSLVSLLCNSN